MSAKIVTRIRITFGRVGRGMVVPDPIESDYEDDDTTAALIVAAVWPYLMSQDVDALIDWDRMNGKIVSGVRPIGTFTIEHISPEVYL